MDFEDDLRRIDGHIAEARRMVHRQKGPVILCRRETSNAAIVEQFSWVRRRFRLSLSGCRLYPK